MTVRHRLWGIAPALALLALAGCRSVEAPTPGQLMQEMCAEGLMDAPGGRGRVEASGTCGAEVRLTPVRSSTTEPMEWMEPLPEFEQHHIEEVDVGPPPSGGGWRWETYITGPGTRLDWYWMENVTVVVRKREVTETWAVPLSHVACTGLPEGVGTMDCTVDVEARSTREQVSAGSWGFQVKGEAGAKWGPLAEGKAGAELAMKFRDAMKTSSTVALVKTHTFGVIKPDQTAYAFVVNRWSRYRTHTIVTGKLCHFTPDGAKDCQAGYDLNAVVTSVVHFGPLVGTHDPPEPAERRDIEGDLLDCSYSRAATINTCTWEATITYGKADSETAEGHWKLFAEGRLGPVKATGEGGRDWSDQTSMDTEVKYGYTLTIAHHLEHASGIYIRQSHLGFRSGETVTEGPWFVYCPPAEGVECS